MTNTEDMMLNIRLIIEYDGTNYQGWQRQPNGPTVQEEIEKAVERMIGRKITLIGSGRTDAGVHALGQSANFHCRTNIGIEELHKGMNSLLPDDIVIRHCAQAQADFHARFDVRSKVYRYTIRNHTLPAAIGRCYHWWIRAPLNVAAMREALKCLLGEHDFKSFEGTGSPRSHTIRQILSADLDTAMEGHLALDIEANGFLRYMVRNIVGTLVSVGRGKLSPAQFADILKSKDRNLAGATAPPQGLCLLKVNY
jgi:tRNA pseudouridine38-40 synthase